MWIFNRRQTLADSGVLRGFTDWHSHILPGVDDGVPTMGEALATLARYESLGVRSVWLTPHVMEDMPNTTASLKERYSELDAAYQGSIRLSLAAEYMLDNLFRERLRGGDLLPLGEKADSLLVETSYFNPPIGLRDMLAGIRSAGLFPVLAHPERYAYMAEGDYGILKDDGVRFQLNLLSLAGAYGREARTRAEWMLKKGYYEVVGTDLHRDITRMRLTRRETVGMGSAVAALSRGL